jgi:hypothetical protein
MATGETELRSDGTNKIIRPSRYNLARVSVVRGEGDKEGVPFIDDYICTNEPIFDYLTEFSGIQGLFGSSRWRFRPNHIPKTIGIPQSCLQTFKVAN